MIVNSMEFQARFLELRQQLHACKNELGVGVLLQLIQLEQLKIDRMLRKCPPSDLATLQARIVAFEDVLKWISDPMDGSLDKRRSTP